MRMGKSLALNCYILINLRSSHLSYDLLAEEGTRICRILRKLFAVLQQKTHVTEPYLNIHMMQALEKLFACFVINYVCILMNALEQLLATYHTLLLPCESLSSMVIRVILAFILACLIM